MITHVIHLDADKRNCFFSEPQYFHIRNQSNQKVLEVVPTGDGWNVGVATKKRLLEDLQLWYEDRAGVIRSRVESLYLKSCGEEKSVSIK